MKDTDFDWGLDDDCNDEKSNYAKIEKGELLQMMKT